MEENGSTVALQAGLPFMVEEFSPLKILHFLAQYHQLEPRAHPHCPKCIVSLLTLLLTPGQPKLCPKM